MAKPVVLLGAGASIDAGLLDTYRLTEAVYESLQVKDRTASRLLGFVIAKLLVRYARKGESPYRRVNIEEAYDALKKVLNRDDDLIGEFVASWEPLIDMPRERVDTFSIRGHLERAVTLSPGLRGSYVSIDQDHLRKGLEGLLNISPPPLVDSTSVLAKCTDVLAKILNPEDKTVEYLGKFLTDVDGKLECIATLNYDTLLEDAARANGVELDFGLTDWNSKRLVRFKGSTQKLLKLHGSVNWYMRNSDEVDFEAPVPSWRSVPRGMIFGGQYDKLNPNGPFLSLRHEFQRSLSKATTVAIVGYSFGDDHLNAMFRSWIAVKRKAKLIVLGPEGLQAASRLTGQIAAWDGRKLRSETVEFHEIKGSFAENVDALCGSLFKAPKPEGRPRSPQNTSTRSGSTKK